MLSKTVLLDNDAYANRRLVFPKLNQPMVDGRLPYGMIGTCPAGAPIYARGVRGVDFLIVLKGSVLITDAAEHGSESVVTIHEAREFTEELNLFSQREALVTARAATAVAVLRVGRERFCEYVAAETDISDIICVP